MSILRPIAPTTITLILTFKCTSACENCCFGCNPTRSKVMSDAEIFQYIVQSLDAYKKSIKVLVITGGECMIYPQKVKDAIKIAKSNGLRTRIVTNGFWATSYLHAYRTIKDLKECGLDEINFSSGDDHVKWVPLRCIRNATVASSRIGFLPVINLETYDQASPKIWNTLLKDKHFKQLYKDRRIQVKRGIWMPFKRGADFSYSGNTSPHTYDGCKSLFSMIPINPYGEVLACCGLICEYVPFLRLGNFKSAPVKDIYESAFDDFLKVWLFVDGPLEILKYIYSKQEIEKEFPILHICDYCRMLFSNRSHIEFIKNNYSEVVGRVMLKFSIDYPQ